MPLKFTHLTTRWTQRLCETHPLLYPEGMIHVSPSDAVMPAMYQMYAQRILDFDVRDDDVWVTGYPKTGTSWTQEMVWLLVNDLNYEGARVPIRQRIPTLEGNSFLKINSQNYIALAEELSPPRCIKCHLPVDLLPTQMWTKKPKIVHVMREVKDAAVSLYHQLCIISATQKLDEYLEAFLEGSVPYGSYWKYQLDFWKLKHTPHILFNTYEEMKQDLPAVIRRTAQFLGKELTAQQVDQLAQHLSFSSMKQNPAINRQHLLSNTFDVTKGQFLAYIRKGEVGDGRRSMSQETAKRFDRWTADQISDSGLPYYGAD